MGQTALCRAVRMAGNPKGQEATPWLKWAVVTMKKHVFIECKSPLHPGQLDNRDRGLFFPSCFPKKNVLFLLSQIYVLSLTIGHLLKSSLETPFQLPKEPAGLLSLQLIFSAFFHFLQWRTSLQSLFVLSIPHGGDCSVQSVSVPSPKHCPYSLWWLLMFNSGAHCSPCAACRYHNNHTLTSHCILVAVGFVVLCPLPAQPGDVGPRILSVPRTGTSCVSHVSELCLFPCQGQSCCPSFPGRGHGLPQSQGIVDCKKGLQCHPACQEGWQIHKFPEVMNK